ncbi:MAG: glutamine-hydrolyzing GMP synthase [Planctomycetia bacterium]|nr:glutamine-hydrolyzing GMP synthase [Planctomycetia bacterium]
MTHSTNYSEKFHLTAEKILIFDFGSQYAQLIARRVREQNVYCEIVRHDLSARRVQEMAPKGIILSGGPFSVYDENAPHCDPGIFELGIPILGICYGIHQMTHHLGGDVMKAETREYGHAEMEIIGEDVIFERVNRETRVWMSHGDQIGKLPTDFIVLARTETCPAAAIRHKERPIFGVQFHPEVTHSLQGTEILKNFLLKICRCTGAWKLEDFARVMQENIRQKVGNDRVICGLSGGVDSSVVAALLSGVLGQNLSCILVDNGFLRKNEAQSVIREFTEHFKMDLHVIHAKDRFLKNLEGVTEPQQKRKIVGHTFIECFSEAAKSIKGAKFLAQGTLYPDVIESGGSPDGPAATIKLHHNVGGLPEDMSFELIEPLRDLFKDEVRRLGKQLGLSDEIVWRHPFPGPGLSVRCLGEVTEEKLTVLKEADAIVLEELRAADLYSKTSQTFAVLLPVQSVGVMGDARTYENALVIRSVNTEDFMTADWSRLPYDVLARMSTRIINEVKGINRVVYDISSKPPATIEWE